MLLRAFGDVVPLWSTINEPVATYVGYALGWFAPGRTSERDGRTANHHVLLAHGEGVRRFRAENLKNADIGIVIDIWNHHPLRADNPGDVAKAELENEKSYRSYLGPLFKGGYSPALLAHMDENGCMPPIQDGDFERIAQPMDYFGLNCYNRVLILPSHQKANIFAGLFPARCVVVNRNTPSIPHSSALRAEKIPRKSFAFLMGE